MKTVKWVSEAFSQQPSSWTVGYGLPKVSRIESEQKVLGAGYVQFWVGYDKDENRLFDIVQSSANVGYFTPSELEKLKV